MIILIYHVTAGSKKISSQAQKKNGGSDGKNGNITEGIKGVTIDDTPLPKSKNLDVLKEFEKAKAKKSASFVVVGK